MKAEETYLEVCEKFKKHRHWSSEGKYAAIDVITFAREYAAGQVKQAIKELLDVSDEKILEFAEETNELPDEPNPDLTERIGYIAGMKAFRDKLKEETK